MTTGSIDAFHSTLTSGDRAICDRLRAAIDASLPDTTAKIWHRHPVWFLNDNPITGYKPFKDCVRLMFWSGADFGEPGLTPGTGKFRDASARYTDADQINPKDLARWLDKARQIQWDYRNVARNKGRLDRIS